MILFFITFMTEHFGTLEATGRLGVKWNVNRRLLFYATPSEMLGKSFRDVLFSRPWIITIHKLLSLTIVGRINNLILLEFLSIILRTRLHNQYSLRWDCRLMTLTHGLSLNPPTTINVSNRHRKITKFIFIRIKLCQIDENLWVSL